MPLEENPIGAKPLLLASFQIFPDQQLSGALPPATVFSHQRMDRAFFEFHRNIIKGAYPRESF
jgi:hypothetical protein